MYGKAPFPQGTQISSSKMSARMRSRMHYTGYSDPYGLIDQPTVSNECRCRFLARNGTVGDFILLNGVSYEYFCQ
jgi:hypothetical protein